jgi:hypothetical protein
METADPSLLAFFFFCFCFFVFVFFFVFFPRTSRPSVGLVSLLLREVGIGIEGLTSLAGSLRHIPSLAKLSLYGNGITDRGAKLIADGVGPTST